MDWLIRSGGEKLPEAWSRLVFGDVSWHCLEIYLGCCRGLTAHSWSADGSVTQSCFDSSRPHHFAQRARKKSTALFLEEAKSCRMYDGRCQGGADNGGNYKRKESCTRLVMLKSLNQHQGVGWDVNAK